MTNSLTPVTPMIGPLGHPHEVRLVTTHNSTVTPVCVICSRVEGTFVGYWLDQVLLELICATCLKAAREVLGDA